MADATVVQGASGTPLLLLLLARGMPIDLTIPDAITLQFKHRTTGTASSGAPAIATWPDPLPAGSLTNCLTYDWAGGGNAEPGDVELEVHLDYAGQPVVFPEDRPLVLHVRKLLAT